MTRGHLPFAAMLVLLAPAVTHAQSAGPGTSAQEMEAAKRAGIPITLRGMQGAVPPPEQNAAIYYAQLGDLRKRKVRARTNLAAIEAAALPADGRGDRIKQAMLRNMDIGSLVHGALKCQACAFPVTQTPVAAAEATQYAPLLTATRWIRAEAFVQWAGGLRPEAVQTLSTGFIVAGHAASSRTVGGFTVACSIDAMILEAFDRMLASKQADARVADAVKAALKTAYRDHSAADCLVGDGVQQLLLAARLKKAGPKAFPDLLRNVRMGPEGRLAKGWKAPSDWVRFLNSGVAYSLWLTRQQMDAVRRPYPQAIRQLSALSAGMRARLAKRDPSALLAAATWSTTALPAQSLARTQARRIATEALAALVTWKLRHGSWPARLADAIRPAPRDPFDLQPLRYARVGSGIAIWSVGPTGRFDATRSAGAAPVGEVGIRWR